MAGFLTALAIALTLISGTLSTVYIFKKVWLEMYADETFIMEQQK